MERLSGLLKKAEPILQAALPPEQVDLLHPAPPVANQNAASKRANSD
jgi:hypothetical protein